MAKHKSPQEERSVILGQPAKRPYGVKVRIHLMTAGAIGVEEVCVPLHSGAFLAIAPVSKAPWEGGQKFLITLEGFPTAASAESAGRRLVQALLWMAVSTDVPLRLEYLSYEPAAIFERNHSSGIICEAYGESGRSPNIALGEIQEAYTHLKEPDEKLLLSMEIFCSARLESSQRAVFLALVSALEPLAQEAPLGDAVDIFVKQCAALLKDSHNIPSDMQNSLNGRLLQLRQESIRQALRRLTHEALPDQPEASKIVDDAYSLWSQIIHSGKPADLDIDLEAEAREISTVIRNIYSNILKRKPAL